ncbi:unnamed protein product [Anisakis simplex]|uniref:Uncharacterized protein n=1 Tax=Anisakis simplex TaxID=6269 RepID=A0A0M3J4E6_ANISI|nr:unnamed protein product [Anisakis simplex]
MLSTVIRSRSESELDKDESGSSTSDSSSENSIGIQENGSSAIIPSYMTTQVLESIRESSLTHNTNVCSIEACEINDQACIYGNFHCRSRFIA